jgi:D-arabinose 1-dehydrogenase-like Zn-dependent alcohol dehydrogenase
MAKMKAAQVPKARADFAIVEREIPQPGPGEVRVRVQACGVCHSDVLTKVGRGRASSTRECQDTKWPG